MTTEELTAWGRDELARRVADLAEMRSGTITLEEVQRRAKVRRRSVGLSMSQAVRWIPGPDGSPRG